jgi:hypothetical protein
MRNNAREIGSIRGCRQSLSTVCEPGDVAYFKYKLYSRNSLTPGLL